MTLEELLKSNHPPEKIALSDDDLTKFFWKFKGLTKEWERANAFWSATNENLKIAYEKLDEKDQELEKAYSIIQEDLSVAHQMQNALLPKMSEKMDEEIELAVYHKQLAEVGGDYYDFFKTKNGNNAIGVFDISGHGVSAALVMTYLKAKFIHILNMFDSPRQIVEWVNNSSYDFLREVKKYSTINFVVFNNDKIQYVCGGGFGLLLNKNVPHHFTKKDNFLGLREKPFNEFELPFEKGDLLALYTDGIVESQDSNGNDYTIKRLNNLIINNSGKTASEILKCCLDDYESFRTRDSDDITLMIIRKK
jgi:sigma-B regulation protein RsbU (phosphoserine phosphatase)